MCNEFSELYSTIFEDAKDQIDVVHNLNRKLEGLTSSYLAAKSEALPEDDIISILKELEQSDFVSSHYPFSEKREGILFRLSDEYSLFYLQFLGNNNSKDVRNWEDYTQTERYKEWSEYAFQNLCLKHIPQIKKAIGIGKAYSRTSNFYKKGTKIELLIDRANGIISICEIKFSKTKLDFDSNMRAEMSRKLSTFQQETKTTQYLQRVIITALGIEHYKQWRGSIDKRVTLDDLFSN